MASATSSCGIATRTPTASSTSPALSSTIRVSQRGAVQGNGPSSEPVITPDGRFVVFTSFASNLFADRAAAADRLR